ncbi:unnamed protein product [Chrysodeixis includens]|uniref:Uncharacterized protein n=1 Tax=Chrysodeixis includens TaxID=689277 RepID=A0A9N8KXD5_CHRIL|nr:unnamed protein product [Chrysodeixis includens]
MFVLGADRARLAPAQVSLLPAAHAHRRRFTAALGAVGTAAAGHYGQDSGIPCAEEAATRSQSASPNHRYRSVRCPRPRLLTAAPPPPAATGRSPHYSPRDVCGRAASIAALSQCLRLIGAQLRMRSYSGAPHTSRAPQLSIHSGDPRAVRAPHVAPLM